MINLSIDCTDVISNVTYIIVKVVGRGRVKHYCSALVKINVDLSAEFTLKIYSTYCTISENYVSRKMMFLWHNVGFYLI